MSGLNRPGCDCVLRSGADLQNQIRNWWRGASKHCLVCKYVACHPQTRELRCRQAM